MSEREPAYDEGLAREINARKEELDGLDSFIRDHGFYGDDLTPLDVRRYIMTRRTAIVAMAAASREVEQSEAQLYGRTISGWHEFLTGDNLAVPCSRYGKNASECAWWAVGGLYLYREELGRSEEVEIFAEELMSYAVNDNADLEHAVMSMRPTIPAEVWNKLKLNGEYL